MTRHGLALGAFAALAALTSSGAAQPPEPVPPTGPAPAPAPGPPPAAPGVGFGFGARAAPPAVQADTGEKPDEEGEADEQDELPWRGTNLVWDQSASGQTVGLGQDYQSDNPSYEMSLALKPVYYVYDDAEQDVSVRGDIGVFRELTNSDTTTKRGETSLTDAQLFGAYSRQLYEDGDYKTKFGVKAPVLTFPTSNVSASNGRILGLGSSLSLGQRVPLAGSDAEALQTLAFVASVGYAHWFTETTVPTNPDLQRERQDVGGRTIPSDQLGGATFAAHQVSLALGAELAITERVSWGNAFSWRPVWSYDLADACIQIQSGCVQADGIDNPSNHSVITLFSSEVGVQVFDEMSVSVGYTNLTLQLGPDGQRRNIFYSPEARVFLAVTGHLDEIYKTATGTRTGGKRRAEELARGPRPAAQ
jgi:hypothetical protein